MKDEDFQLDTAEDKNNLLNMFTGMLQCLVFSVIWYTIIVLFIFWIICYISVFITFVVRF